VTEGRTDRITMAIAGVYKDICKNRFANRLNSPPQHSNADNAMQQSANINK